MNCEQAKELIVEFLYDELPPEFAPELQEHLEECEDCLRYKEEVQGTLERLNQAKELQAPVDLAVLHDAVGKKRHRVRQFLRRQWPVWAAIGSCGIILLVFTLFVSEIRYEDNALTIRFDGQETDPLPERTARVLTAYWEDQLRFQTQMSDELRAEVNALSQMIGEYAAQRDRQISGAFQKIQIQQYQVLAAIQKELEILASQTEDEFRRSYLTMVELANLQ